MTTIKDQLREKQGIIDNQQRTIESLISQSEEARKRTDTILMKLTTDISNLQKSLEYRKSESPMQASNSGSLSNPQKEDTPARSAPKVSSQAGKMPPVQRELNLWESVQLYVNDISGFFLGRG